MKLANKTIIGVFEDRVKKSPDNIFLRYNGHAYTWKMVDNITTNFAKIMLKEGVTPNDSVGLTGINTDNFIFIFLAIQKIGATAVLINSHYKGKEIKECIQIAKIKYFFFADIEDHRVELKTELEQESGKNGYKVYTAYSDFDTWMSYNYEDENKFCFADIDPNKTAVVLFTSGTTSKSKGVQLSHYSVVNNAIEVSSKMKWTQNDKLCLTVPLFHCFGITISLLTSIISGMEIIVLEKFRTVNVCQAIEKYRCTVLNGVPSMFLAMLKNPKFHSFDLSTLESGIIAGSPITQAEYVNICKQLNMDKLQRSYGLTEASPCITISDYDDTILKKSNTEGKVIDHVQVEIRDIETGNLCPEGCWGEICVKGYNVTQGYLAGDHATYTAIQPDGYLNTGDLGYFDEDGYLYIVGRIKNLIIRGGENISPVEIEEYINRYDNNLNVFVLGIKSEVLQEEIVACIEGEENKAKEEGLKEYLNNNLSKYKIPAYFIYMKKFPETPTGKVDERKLKEIVEKQLGIGQDSL